MANNTLRLSRKQLSTFLKDHEQIVAFENLFAVAERSAPDVIESVGLIASSAQSAAQSALDQIISLRNDTDNSLSATGSQSVKALQQIGIINDALTRGISSKLVIVDSRYDLPLPVAGVITLDDNYTYFFVSTVDLAGDRIVSGQNTTIIGTSSENSRIKSTGLVGTALITSEWSLPMRTITLESGIALDLDAGVTPNQALDWYGVNFTNCATVGTIANYANFLLTDGAFLESGGLTFDGSIGTVAFTNTLINAGSATAVITLPATLTITRRFRISYSSFVVGVGETGLSVSAAATIPDESYILDTVYFSGGGTYTSGVTYSDNKARWTTCVGVSNSAAIAQMTMVANATATVVAASATDYKVAGTTTLESISQRFTHSNNKLTYQGAIPRDFRVFVTTTMESGNNDELGVKLAKNGTVISNSENFSTTSGTGKSENGSSNTIVSLTDGDYIEVYVSNETSSTNITVAYMNVIVEAPI